MVPDVDQAAARFRGSRTRAPWPSWIRNVPKLVTSGYLQSHFQLYGWRRKAGTLRRADVQRLIALRREAQLEQAAQVATRAKLHGPPNDEHEWLSVGDDSPRPESAAAGGSAKTRSPSSRPDG